MTLKVKFRTQFPANVTVQSPLLLTKTGSNYDFSFDGYALAAASNVAFTPTGGVSSTDVQTAIAELDSEKTSTSSLSAIATSGAPSDLASGLTAWTPALTFATPGDLAVAYTTQFGRYSYLSANVLFVQFHTSTSSFTFTTASGGARISGLPFTSQNTSNLLSRGAVSFGGINKAGYTQVSVGMGVNSNFFVLNASGMGVAASAVSASDMPTGGTVILIGEVIIFL